MAKNEQSSNSQPSFEQSMEALEALVKKLENPETPLETVVECFTEGQKLLKACQKRLEAAELVLEKATEEDKTEKI